MDRLTAFVALAHVQLRIEYLKRHPEIIEGIEMTPNLAGLPATLAILRDNLEVRAAKLAGRATAVNARTIAALSRAETQMTATEKAAEDIEAFANALEGNNGGPTLDGSSEPSENTLELAPEKLTTNGVSVP